MDYSTKEDVVEYFFDRIKYFTLPSQENNFKSRFLESNLLLYCVVLLLIFKIITVFVPINFPKNIFFADITQMALENFANQTRQSAGLQPLVENPKLDEAAQLKAENMVANDYFAHTSPTGITPWYWFSAVGYNYKYAGENLAVGFFDSQEVYNAWLNSPEHKANILNPNYKEFGTAVLSGFGPNNSIIVVQEFGALPTAAAKPVISKTTTATPVVTQPKQNPDVAPNEQTDSQQTVTANNSNIANSPEKVLSQTTEAQPALQVPKTSSSNPYSKIINSVLYGYNEILQNVIYGVSLVVIGILLAMIFFSLNFNFRKELVIRSVLIVILLSAATVLNKELIISIIPHQIII